MRPTDPRLLRRLAPARRPLAGVLLGGGAGALLLLAQAWTVTGLVVAAVRGTDVAPWAVAVVAVLAGRAVVAWVVEWCAARAAALVGTDVRRRLVPALLRAGDRRTTGEVAALATRGVSAAEPYLTRYVPALVLAVVLPPLTLVAIATQDLLSAVIVLATIPLVPVFGALVGLATRDRAEHQWRALASLSGHFLDVVRGLPTLVAFRRAEAQSARISEITDRYRRRTMETLKIAFLSSAVLELVATLSVALVAVTVGVRLAAGSLDLSTALVVLLLAPEAYWPLRRVGQEFHAAAEGVATFGRVSELLDAPADPEPAPPGHGPLLVESLTVRHPGRTVPALDRLDALVPAHGVTVVTGPSGCGKSTLLAVLAGLLAPTEGRVGVGGRPAVGPAWQERIAWVPQRPGFVAGTIGDNLRLARPDATDDELWAALRTVALEERVGLLPGGLDAALGEDGTTLSAGERARLALARVVVARRPWVLLDEPTAHLDDLTEQVVADTLVELGRRSAVVVVAHRPALVALADHVIELPAAARAAAPATPGPVPPPAAGAVAPARAGAPVAPPAAPTAAPTAAPPVGSRPTDRRRLAVPTALGALASASGVALTATAGWLIVQAATRPPVLTLLVAVVCVRAFGVARPALRYAERLGSHDVALRLLAERRTAVYRALVPLTPGSLGRRRGDLLAAVVDDVDSVLDRELRVRMPVRGFVAVAALAAIFAVLVQPAAGLVVAAVTVAAGSLGFGLARAGAARAERAAVDDRAALSEAVVDTASLAPELTLWQAVDPAAERVAAISDELGRRTTRSALWLGAGRAAVLAVTGLGVASAAVALAPATAAGALSRPMLALLVLLPLALGDVAAGMADAGALAARTRAAEARLAELTARRPAVASPRQPAPAGPGRDLAVEDVRAGWGGTDALRDLRLQVPEAGRVAVVGPSGSGKSTLAALLLRFVDPRSGRVLLGGSPLTGLHLDDVRRRVGLVDDDPHVFATTLVENVRLARPEASDAEVEGALRAARLGDWLDALPEGLDTWLGDGHAAVSGGERARLAIARSLLAEQPVLVLDEPTAHLDSATATDLAEEVFGGERRRTVVWITHGTAGLDLADAVVDLGSAAHLSPQEDPRHV